MLIAIIGENCTGKTTIANQIKYLKNIKSYTGKDYLRLSKNPQHALQEFKKILNKASNDDEDVIWIISEYQHLDILPENSYKILVTADLEEIKKRFSERIRGVLPISIEKMLERNHGMFDNINFNIRINSNETNNKEFEEFLNGLKYN